MESFKKEGINTAKGVKFLPTPGKSRAIVKKLGGCKECDF
jgi:hypothetical protein